MQKDRIFYLDLVKTLAIYLVLFAHSYTYGTKLYTISVSQKIYPFYLWLDCLRTINNPLFFMTSGALLISLENGKGDLTNIQKQFKRIAKYALILILFSFFQYRYQIFKGEFKTMGVVTFFKYIYSTPIHFTYWFLYAYLGYLIMLPFTCKIACNISYLQFKYLIFITLLFTDILPIFQYLVGLSRINISLYLNVYSYSVFPIVGYYLHHHMDKIIFNKKWKIFVLIGLSLLGSSIAAVLTHIEMLRDGNYTENFISCFNLLTSITIFCICYKLGNYLESKKIIRQLISAISSCTLGIYLLENIIEDRFSKKIFQFLPEKYPQLTICALYITLTIIIGTFIIYCVKKLPVIRKLL